MSQEKNFLIYGANGYTGELIVRLAVEKGHRPVIAGRNAEKIEALGKELGLETRIFDLDDGGTIVKNLEGFSAVLHCAGPFFITARPMIKACLQAKVHYLDITGEIEVFEYAAAKGEEARDAGIVLMPGVGFDVVPSDCLAAHLSSRLPEADHLELAFKGGGGISRGTALTMMENMHKGGAIRKDGKIRKVPAAYETREITFGEKKYMTSTIPWGDVSTAFYSTGIPNIKVFTATRPKAIKFMKMTNRWGWIMQWGIVKNYMRKRISKTTGPSKETRENTRSQLWGRAFVGDQVVGTQLTTAEGYKLTAMTAVGSVERLLTQSVFAGFKTPSMAFGPDFILEFEGSEREDL